MRRYINFATSTLLVFFLGACFPTPQSGGSNAPQLEDVHFIPIPEPHFSTQEFVSLFEEICLKGKFSRAVFERKARARGLFREADLKNYLYPSNRYDGPQHFTTVWITKTEYSRDPIVRVTLRYRTLFAPALDVPDIQLPEAFDPSEAVLCSVAMFMPELTTQERSDLESLAKGDLLKAARQDGRYDEFIGPLGGKPEDVEVRLDFSTVLVSGGYENISRCSPKCRVTPNRLTLWVVTDRYPPEEE